MARDIRNNLSRSFLLALAEKDASLFQECASSFRHRNPGPVYEQYMTARLEKYEKAYAIITRDKQTEPLQQAAILWDLELFFEMHETLEEEWRKAEGERRKALQGLIRAAGMMILANHKRSKAAVSMGAKALVALEQYGRALEGLHNLAAILAAINRILFQGPAESPGA